MRLPTLLFTALAPVLYATVPAAAFDPTGNAVADGFLAIIQSAGYADVEAGSVDRRDGETVIEAVVASAPERGETLTFGTVAIAGGSIDADNALSAGQIRYGDIHVASTGGEQSDSSAGSMVVTGARLPLREAAGSWLATVFGEFDSATIESLTARTPDGGPVAVAKIEIAREDRDSANVVSGRIGLTGIAFDVSLLTGPASGVLRDLGYDSLTVDAAVDGYWDSSAGTARLDALSLSAADVGAVTLSASAGGLTEATISTLAASIADVGQILTLLQGINVDALTVAATDDGLVGRLVSQAAQARNIDAEAVRAQTVATVEAALAMLDNADFTAEIAGALRTFLDKPGTLTLSAEPPAGTSLAQVFGGAVMQPKILPSLLNVTVSASAAP